MKRMLLLLAALLCCAAAGLAEDAYLNVQALRETAPARWTAHFETAWRAIDVDAEVLIPQVQQLPVVWVSGGATEPALTAQEAGWDHIERRTPYDLILFNDDTAYPKSVDGVRIAGQPVSKGSWYGDFDIDRKSVV